MSEGTRLIRVSKDLLDFMGTRAENGDRLSFEWGEPDLFGGIEPVYTPTVHADRNDNLVDSLRLERDRLREAARVVVDGWFGNGFDPAAFDVLRAALEGAGEGGTDG